MATHCELSVAPVKSSKKITFDVAVPVKLIALTFALLMLTAWLLGLNVAVALLGVSV
jgi:hypothetical protein